MALATASASCECVSLCWPCDGLVTCSGSAQQGAAPASRDIEEDTGDGAGDERIDPYL